MIAVMYINRYTERQQSRERKRDRDTDMKREEKKTDRERERDTCLYIIQIRTKALDKLRLKDHMQPSLLYIHIYTGT